MRKLNSEQSELSVTENLAIGHRLLEGKLANWNNLVARRKETKSSISWVVASEKEEAQTQTFLIGGFGQSCI